MDKENKKRVNLNIIGKIWAMVFMICTGVFIFYLSKLNMLGYGYFVPICLIAIAIAGLVIIAFADETTKKPIKIIAFIISLIFTVGYLLGIHYISETNDFLNKVTIEDEEKVGKLPEEKDITKTPFNVMVTGLDTEGSISNKFHSDVNMVVTVNPVSKKILMTSIPRDSYVALKGKACSGPMDKLTHTGLYGPEETRDTVANLLDINIEYYGKVNFTTVVDLINAIGGIDVYSDYTFDTHGMDEHFTFYEGSNHLDGIHALAFARERKSFASGDLQRNKNQQIIVEAVLNKVLQSKTLLTSYKSILESVEDYIEIGMPASAVKNLVRMQTNDMSSWDIERQTISGTPSSNPCYSVGGAYASTVDLNQEDINNATKNIKKVLEIE